jgi:PAT family beta-lactamase induction signal transducer AmpG
LALAGLAFGDPGHWIVWSVVVSLVLGFAGATQDVTIDGWPYHRGAAWQSSR